MAVGRVGSYYVSGALSEAAMVRGYVITAAGNRIAICVLEETRAKGDRKSTRLNSTHL